MARKRVVKPLSNFIDNQCHEAGFENPSKWAKAIHVPKTSLYNLITRASNVVALELHQKLAQSRGLSLDDWAALYIAAMKEVA